MSESPNADLAARYLVEDLPGAARTGARLNGILQTIEVGDKLSPIAQAFLKSSGLASLLALATGQVDRRSFEEAATRERVDRIRRAQEDAERAAAEELLKKEAIDAAITAQFAAMDNDPVRRKQREARGLRDRFSVGFIEPEHYSRAMRLLREVANRGRLEPEDVAWLSAEASECWTEGLQQAWHRLEAEALSKAWEDAGDLWDAVNASAHWRKANEPLNALSITEQALRTATAHPKARSAILTTRGGALRDTDRPGDAREAGLEAHHLTPGDFRPCTLLGAVSMELGDLSVGQNWYAKAEELGAERRTIDQDLRALLLRAKPEARERIRSYLLEHDPDRFVWLQKWNHKTNAS